MEYSISAGDTPLIGEIRRCIYELRNCILLAGSGLSAQAVTQRGEHPPSWKGLLAGMAEWCVRNRLIERTYAEALASLVASGYLVEAGQELDEILHESAARQQCVKDVLHSNEITISKAHEHMAQIPFRGYLTTNYDNLIEAAFSKIKGRALPAFYEASVDSVLHQYREEECFILKLHGDVNDSGSIVLGDRSYERIRRNADYRGCIATLFAMASILFVGFVGSDPDVDGLLSNVAAFDGRRVRHWMLVPSHQFPALKVKRLLKDRGVQVVEYEHDQTHSGLVGFLAALAPSPAAPARTLATLESSALPEHDVSVR